MPESYFGQIYSNQDQQKLSHPGFKIQDNSNILDSNDPQVVKNFQMNIFNAVLTKEHLSSIYLTESQRGSIEISDSSVIFACFIVECTTPQ